MVKHPNRPLNTYERDGNHPSLPFTGTVSRYRTPGLAWRFVLRFHSSIIEVFLIYGIAGR